MESTYFATAPNGMADLLATELKSLGASSVSETRAGAQFSGDLEVAYRACLWSRLANRILLPLATFDAPSPEALYAGVRTIDWSTHMGSTQTLAVDTHVSSSKITHSHYAALKIKDAIVDSFAESVGVRPSVDVDQPDIRINCYLHRDTAMLYLDLSGNSLHQRNYRLGAGQAPLKENLAAALLLRARWPEMAQANEAFVDPMCGSGTLVIEAAMMAADIAPGLTRRFYGFLGWKQHSSSVWARLLAEANYRREQGVARLQPMLGFDIDRRVLDAARENAARAGLTDKVSFAYQDLFDFRHDFPSHGLVVTNPPYGRRLLESGELPALYGALGQTLRRDFRGWKAAVFTEDQSLGKHIGIRAGKLHTLYNGAIACKLIHFSIEEANFYRDNRLPRRVNEAELSEQSTMFRNRLLKNLKQIRKLAKRDAVTCYRIYDADLPDYAAAIDVYQNADASGEYWVCVAEYEAPSSIDEKKAKFRTRELITQVQSALDLDDEHVFYKTRARQRGERQYEKLDTEQQFHVVSEGACKLLVNFEDYLDTGLFLDHRPIRQRLFKEAAGRDFLNLFAYTGAATVHAALGGANTTTTVDMSQTYLAWAKRNFALNNLPASHHRTVQADCVQWLARSGANQYDLIFLDPPTFSNSKRMEDTFDVQRDHVGLIEQSLRLLRAGGTLYFSTNQRSFRIDAALVARTDAKDISATTISFDFKRRQNIHQCWQFQRDSGAIDVP